MRSADSNTPPVDIVLISGGTAMTASARALKQYTSHSLHFLSPFDSGGSSAALRSCLGLPALGDLRSRLVALADEQQVLSRERASCLAQRCPPEESGRAWLERQLGVAAELRAEDAWSELVAATRTLRTHLPEDFPWPQASFGNLMMAAGLHQLNWSLSQLSQQLQRCLRTQGQARCIVDASLHLYAQLENGETVIGQHRLTGKQAPPLKARIQQLGLSADPEQLQIAECPLNPEVRQILQAARLIVFCPGSFYTSVLAQLLPSGMTAALAASPARKIYIPNLGRDPELYGYTPAQALQRLRQQLHPATLDGLLIDSSQLADYRACKLEMQAQAIADETRQHHDPLALARNLHGLLQSAL